ncbi:MAG TPA: methyltransferase domain-containing protein [Thermoleophilaceae bacterium]|nr:methyltransferase domain-containing protein [Thermoleophilaceae bacterium]
MTTTTTEGSAARQGALWGARPADWAETEARQLPTYRTVIERVGLAPGDRVADLGCGAGTFLGLAAEHGARVAGLDAARSLLAIAAERVPGADLRQGDLERLPWDDDRFDLVTGFNSFFFAADIGAALAEARRVARPGADVVIQVWGRPDRCDLGAMIAAMGQLRDARPAAPAGPPLWQPGVVEHMARGAGLEPRLAFDYSCAFDYADEDELVRGMAAAGGVVEAAAAVGDEPVRRAILDSLARFRAADGSYRLANEWRSVVATA